MGDVHYLWGRSYRGESDDRFGHTLPESAYVADRAEKIIVIGLEWFLQLADYSHSQPTGARPGRIYLRNEVPRDGTYQGLKPPRPGIDRWWLYICEADPTEEGYVLHHPHEVVILETAS